MPPQQQQQQQQQTAATTRTTTEDVESLLLRRGGSPPISLSPANATEQWNIVQSFELCASASCNTSSSTSSNGSSFVSTNGDEPNHHDYHHHPATTTRTTTAAAQHVAMDLATVIEKGLDWDRWTTGDVDKYLESYGANELPKPELDSYFTLWIRAFYDIMMILLVVAMIVLYAVGDAIAATAILIIVLIATNIGAYTEYSSNKAAAELGDLPGTSLIRAPKSPDAMSQQGWLEINNTKLLPGMILLLRTGDIVPSDAIILTQETDCSCAEAMLTGESEPVHKYMFHHGVPDDDPHVQEKRQSMTRLFMGTEFSGECIALVVETGQRTQMGQIFLSMAQADPEQSPLQKMIDTLIYVLALLSIAVSVVNAAVCIPTGRGIEPNNEDPEALLCVLNSIALTVAAVPENLPVALVIALAAIIKNLARKGVIVKSLPAGEELSRLNYVFADKTGTLTKNEMTARAVVTLNGYCGIQSNFVGPQHTHSHARIVLTDQIRILAATAQDDLRSNPTGIACKNAYPNDQQQQVSVERIALEAATSKTKMARCALILEGKRYLVKVGSDWVLRGATGQATMDTNLCNLQMDSIQDFDKQRCMAIIETWAKEGYRVICVAAKPVETLPETIHEDDDENENEEESDFGWRDNFIFLGCLVIQDPPRDDVAENIRIIRGAGVVVTMITGDNPITGMSIARQIGLAANYNEQDLQMLLINAFDFFHVLNEEEARQEIRKRLDYSMTHKKGLIIGRVSPFQKRLFVEVARSMGLVVAMTGDGANDAPALRGANVGIAIGSGSDIAKAAGDMILVSPSFSGIVEAIRAGRLGFDNILKFLLFLLGTNVSEVLIYLTLTFADIVIVLDALNLLVLNLLTDGFPAIALSLEQAEGDLMKRSPLRKDTSVLNKFTYISIFVTNTALMISYITVILWGNVRHLGDITGRSTDEVDDYDLGLEKVRMMFILLINISELLLGFSHRAPDRSVFSVGFFSGKWMNWASLSSMAVIILMTHIPGLKSIMRTDYPDFESYLLVAGMSILPFVVHEVAKVVIFQRLNFNVYELYKYKYMSQPLAG